MQVLSTLRQTYHRKESYERSLPFRRSRNSSFQATGRRSSSRSPSPVPGNQYQAPELLCQCISILSSIVSEDCRFKIASPRPSRPPYALQALTLDVAQFLIHSQRQDPGIISRIGFALIPAFVTFREAMQIRLFTFFETVVIRGMLEELRCIQGKFDTPVMGACPFVSTEIYSNVITRCR
jgi:hypothetical protein